MYQGTQKFKKIQFYLKMYFTRISKDNIFLQSLWHKSLTAYINLYLEFL